MFTWTENMLNNTWRPSLRTFNELCCLSPHERGLEQCACWTDKYQFTSWHVSLPPKITLRPNVLARKWRIGIEWFQILFSYFATTTTCCWTTFPGCSKATEAVEGTETTEKIFANPKDQETGECGQFNETISTLYLLRPMPIAKKHFIWESDGLLTCTLGSQQRISRKKGKKGKLQKSKLRCQIIRNK